MKCTKPAPSKGVIMLKPSTLDSNSTRPRSVNVMLKNVDTINTEAPRWNQVMSLFQYNRDPLLVSVMKQAREREFNDKTRKLTLTFSKDFSFFERFIQNSINHLWKPLIEKVYGEVKRIEIIFGESEND